MSSSKLWLMRWRGVILASVAVVATIWLAVTDQLILYIHPRYIVFTVIMALIALALTLISALLPRDHRHPVETTRVRNVLSVMSIVVTLVLAAAIVTVPPATLTSATAEQRDVNSAAVGIDDTTVDEAESSGASETFSVRDWASLLRQTTDLAFYADKPADIVGFVSADPSDPENLFYVSRFVVTCCAVDAQPVGVSVYLPDWKTSYVADEWVHVTGTFATNPSRDSDEALVLIPQSIEKVAQPDDPYLF